MIGKAPILKSYLAHDGRVIDGEVVFPDLQDQRNADDQYYPKAIYEWGNEFCVEHVADGYIGGSYRLRRECPKCWQSLLQQVEGK